MAEWWVEYSIKVLHTGSSVVCDPPVKDTDDDYLCLVDKDSLEKFEDRLEFEGFKLGGSLESAGRKLKKWILNEETGVVGTQSIYMPLSEYPDLNECEREQVFRSWKAGKLNIIVTCSPDYFTSFSHATFIAKKLNLINKEDRITLFEALCFNVWPNYSKYLKQLIVKDDM